MTRPRAAWNPTKLEKCAAMSQFIHEHSARVRGQDGTEYRAITYAKRRDDGTWEAWLEFKPSAPSAAVLRTGQETSQPDRKAVEYWAGGLEPVYLEGALARANRVRSPSRQEHEERPTL